MYHTFAISVTSHTGVYTRLATVVVPFNHHRSTGDTFTASLGESARKAPTPSATVSSRGLRDDNKALWPSPAGAQGLSTPSRPAASTAAPVVSSCTVATEASRRARLAIERADLHRDKDVRDEDSLSTSSKSAESWALGARHATAVTPESASFATGMSPSCSENAPSVVWFQGPHRVEKESVGKRRRARGVQQ